MSSKKVKVNEVSVYAVFYPTGVCSKCKFCSTVLDNGSYIIFLEIEHDKCMLGYDDAIICCNDFKPVPRIFKTKEEADDEVNVVSEKIIKYKNLKNIPLVLPGYTIH